jgi:hypothetical protein
MEANVTANNFGHGQCTERLDSRWPCSQAAYTDDQLCYYHSKLAHRVTRRLEQEPKPAPAPRKKKVTS